jgi:hypothetical protein
MPSSAITDFQNSIDSCAAVHIVGRSSRQPERALRDQATMYLVGAQADHPHQRMAQLLFEVATQRCTGAADRASGSI